MEMCTAESGRMMNLSRASSPEMVNPGMEVGKMWQMDYRLVYIFKKNNVIFRPFHV
jgi:hypothetical protein